MTDKPFLTIITRCCHRPNFLTRNIESVQGQTDRDVEQVFIVDDNKNGVLWANRQFAANTHRIEGEYVYILDDDTRLTDLSFVQLVKAAVKKKRYPEVLMIKSSRPQFSPHVLPKRDVWQKKSRLRMSSTNCLCYAVKRDSFIESCSYFGSRAAGDWHFLKRLLAVGSSFGWLDKIVAETQQLGRGRLFEQNVSKNWFQQVVRKQGAIQIKKGDWRLRHWTVKRVAGREAKRTPPRPDTKPSVVVIQKQIPGETPTQRRHRIQHEQRPEPGGYW